MSGGAGCGAGCGAGRGSGYGAGRACCGPPPNPLQVLGAKCLYWIEATNVNPAVTIAYNMGALGAARNFALSACTRVTDFGKPAIAVPAGLGNCQVAAADFANGDFAADWVVCRQAASALRTYSSYNTATGPWHRIRWDGVRVRGAWATNVGGTIDPATLPAIDPTSKHRMLRSRLTPAGVDLACDASTSSTATANAGVSAASTGWRTGFSAETPVMNLRGLVVARGIVTDSELAGVDRYMRWLAR